jgi:hypothetical protein
MPAQSKAVAPPALRLRELSRAREMPVTDAMDLAARLRAVEILVGVSDVANCEGAAAPRPGGGEVSMERGGGGSMVLP